MKPSPNFISQDSLHFLSVVIMDTSFLIGPVEQPLLLHNHTHNRHHILHQEEEMLVTLNNQMNFLFALLTLMLKNVSYLAMGEKKQDMYM